ncbi:uncharacterized protein MONOS_2360 [Monocercomonoides exilis]|uniref:uncharacterized protein n=1 Tax=Monocercomonoides exilis TaxID=2049356 RepID=UPI00355A0333|nr:hypothetical protein MONOS_2360 [Monocercomonoides exilis]|eukprot:MONOS_2360.1-p1 / transcript=MONOS_2360.1 / gene=MONOS_2360 / organism=Monocercomonoides_exilis_PA203 / gene_product=unspecified product / transcript_product=unspecified product / location=Mono_scaffold00048:91708-91979(-) / protein_length=71 / sequence_SO=supercontig / SO=protein_coding / is_pseudo=false
MQREQSDGTTQCVVGGFALLMQQKRGRQSTLHAVFFFTPRGSECGGSSEGQRPLPSGLRNQGEKAKYVVK